MDLSDLKFQLESIGEPLNLDDETESDGKCSIKFTFDSFSAYAPYEEDLKEFAERIGAVFSVIKV